MRAAIFLAAMTAVVLAGCQQRPTPQFQIEESRSYDLPRETVWNDILAFLRSNDITVREADLTSGVIEAQRDNFQDAGWAYCEPARISDSTSDSRRQRRTQVFLDRSLMLTVDIRTVGDAVLVAPDASFTERQVNSFKNLPFDVPCRSTGALEKALLDAIGPPTGTAATPSPSPAGTN